MQTRRSFERPFCRGCPASGLQGAALYPEGPSGEGNLRILFSSFAEMLGIFISTIVGALSLVWWFRVTNTKAHYVPDFTFLKSGRALPREAEALAGVMASMSDRAAGRE